MRTRGCWLVNWIPRPSIRRNCELHSRRVFPLAILILCHAASKLYEAFKIFKEISIGRSSSWQIQREFRMKHLFRFCRMNVEAFENS